MQELHEVTSDKILEWVTDRVREKKMVSPEVWLEIAFRLNLLGIEESQLLHKMRQAVAQKKLEIYQKQEKRNVTAAELEVEASDEYRFMKDQESKCDAILQFIQIAKKNVDTAY